MLTDTLCIYWLNIIERCWIVLVQCIVISVRCLKWFSSAHRHMPYLTNIHYIAKFCWWNLRCYIQMLVFSQLNFIARTFTVHFAHYHLPEVMSPVILLALIEQHMPSWTLCSDTLWINCEEYIIILRVHISTELKPSLTAKQNECEVYDWLWVTVDVTNPLW